LEISLHIFLRNEVDAFDFSVDDFSPFRQQLPELELVYHQNLESLEAALPEIEYLATWDFIPSWLSAAKQLKAVFTPAAGRDWIAIPEDRGIKVFHGSFHGPLLAESLLGAMLFLNRNMPGLLINAANRTWDRNFQTSCRRLKGQTVLLLGYGAIGRHCGSLLTGLGLNVLGFQRQQTEGVDRETGVHYVDLATLDSALAESDHVVLLLPGDSSTDRFLNLERLTKLKPGAFVYNFGRGNSLLETDLLTVLENGQCGGAVLDVTSVEPLPTTSDLWRHPRVLVMPHSSCVYSEYRPYYVAELTETLRSLST